MALTAVFCLALELPAMAKVTGGGKITLDWTYINKNAERASGGVPVGSKPSSNGFKDMNFVVPRPWSRLDFRYTSDDEVLSARIEFRGGGPDDASTTLGGLNYLFMAWQITPNNLITFGTQTSAFARFIPRQFVGTHVGTTMGVGFGDVHHGTTRTGIKGYWRMSDMFGLVWGLYDADVVPPSRGIALATTSAAVTAAFATAQENKLPRIDLALPIRFSWGRIEPSVTWSQARYDQFPPGAEDSYDMYGFCIGGQGDWGMFRAIAEFTWGRNLGGGSYRGAEGARPIAYLDTSGNIRIADADVFGYLVDVGFRFGPNLIDLYYMSIKYENDGDPSVPQTSDSAQYNFTQFMYGISWRISLAGGTWRKGLIIRPELNFFDFDSSAQVSGTTVDRGKEWLLGVQFMFTF
jgi:hypothetical protein